MPDTNEPEGPSIGDVDAGERTRIVSHDVRDYPDGRVSVGGTIENPTDRPLGRVEVTVVLFDERGDRIAEATDVVSTLPPGGAATYSVTFEDVAYSEVARYRVVSTVDG